jgi:hypothetical protein
MTTTTPTEADARRMFAERCQRALAGGTELIGKYPLGNDNDCTCPDAVRLRHVRRALEEQGVRVPLGCKHAVAADLYRRYRAGLTTRVPMPGGYSLVIRPKIRADRQEVTA